jgi:TP901 family phage tail tape measure protein
MATFNLTAQLNLKGPTNVKQIAAQIKKDLGALNANVQFKLDPAASKNVAALSSSLKVLNANFASTVKSANAATSAIKAFGNSVNSVKINNVPQQINQTSSAIAKLNKVSSSTSGGLQNAATEMQEFGKQAGLAVRRFVAFSAVTSVIYGVTNSINNGIQAFIDYDKELVKLQQVTGESAAGLSKLQSQISNLAVEFGVSSKELTQVASTLAQAGLSARETEKALKALALSSLAPSFDNMNETVEGSIAIMRQFGISAADLEASLGAVNTVAARFAVESSDIITAVQRTGSVFATASKGVSEGKDALNEFISVFTSVRATTRESAETIATGLRTIFTRIQRGTTIDALKEFGVNLTDAEGKFVGAYKAVELLSKGLGKIDPRSLDFSRIVEELGGFRQIGKVIPLIQQFSVAQQALKVAQQGQGSLAKDAATAQLSLANQISKVREEFFSLFREIGQSKGFQSLIRGALSLTSGLIKVADAVKGILPALAVLAAFKGFKALTEFTTGFATGVKRGPDGKANGGVIRKFARGGVVPGTGSGDTVPAMLEPGEFVIRKKAVETIGTDSLHSMNKYGSGGSIRAGKSNRRKRFGGGGKLYDDIDVQEYSKSNKQYAGRLKAYDADSINLLVDPTQTLVNKRFKKLTGDLIYPSEKGKFKVTSRLEGIDAFEIKASKKEREEYASQGGKGPAYASNREKGKRAKDITIDFISGLGKEKLAKIFIDANKVDYYGRPMAEIGALNKKLVGENVAKYSGTKKGQDIIQADKLANRLEIMKKNSGFGNTNKSSWDRVIKDDYMFNYMPAGSKDRFNSSGNIIQDDSRPLKTISDIGFIKKMTETKGLAKFMVGGKVERKIGVVDTDVLRDEANAAIVRPAMEKLGITDVSDYTTKLGELAGNARKSGSLSRFRAIAGAAGSGKSSLATGKGANDDATLRKTIRSQILTPEDIDKVNEVIVLTSTASQTKLDAYLKDVDRAYVLSSNSREEQDRVRSNRESRDITGEGLYGRKPGTTRAADIDFGLEETILRDELGKRATVLGRKKDSFGLRRKRESELPEIVQAGGFYMGGFAPPTRGHRGALDTLLENMLAKNPNSSLEDILVSVAPDLPMIVDKEGIDHAARYGIFPSDIRTLFSQMNFGNAMISTQSQTGGGLPKFMEVTDAGDRRKFARLKGAMAITSGKDDKTLGKYQRAGIDVTDIPRIEDISATAVRDALFNGDDKTLTSLMNPDIASILMGNRAQLRNRSTMVPMLIEEIQKFVDQDKVRSNAEVTEILSNAPGGPYGNVSADLKKNYPEIAEQVKQIRDKRDRVSKGAFGYRAFNIISALSAKYPETYGLDPSRKSAVSAQPSDITREAIAAQISEQMAGEFGGVPTAMPSGLEEAILKNVEKATQVKKSSGILPTQGSEILKRFGTQRLPNDPSFGPFSGKTVRDTAEGGKLKYWNSAFRPETKEDKLAYYIATRDYLIDKFNESQGIQKATALEDTTNAVLSSKQLGLVGLNPLGYTGLLGPETWNLGVDPSGQERSIDASIVQRGLPTEFQNVIDYLSGQTAEIVQGASKLLGITPKE